MSRERFTTNKGSERGAESMPGVDRFVLHGRFLLQVPELKNPVDLFVTRAFQRRRGLIVGIITSLKVGHHVVELILTSRFTVGHLVPDAVVDSSANSSRELGAGTRSRNGVVKVLSVGVKGANEARLRLDLRRPVVERSGELQLVFLAESLWVVAQVDILHSGHVVNNVRLEEAVVERPGGLDRATSPPATTLGNGSRGTLHGPWGPARVGFRRHHHVVVNRTRGRSHQIVVLGPVRALRAR